MTSYFLRVQELQAEGYYSTDMPLLMELYPVAEQGADTTAH